MDRNPHTCSEGELLQLADEAIRRDAAAQRRSYGEVAEEYLLAKQGDKIVGASTPKEFVELAGVDALREIVAEGKRRPMASVRAQSGVFQELRLEQLTPSGNNPRIFRENDPKLQELAASIREMGVLEPILVRPMDEDGAAFEILAGERRFRAARMAELDVIPAMVRQLDDDQALHVTITENMQREDVHPLEECNAIANLAGRGWTLEDIATQLGKSARWVARRHSLNNLTAEWRDALVESELFGAWGASHYEQIARLPAETQERLLDTLQEHRNCDWPDWTAGVFAEHIDQFRHALRGAPWKLTDAALVAEAGACASCVKRSGAAPDLFEGKDAAKDDTCLDAGCWFKKLDAWAVLKQAALKEKFGSVILTGDEYTPDRNLPSFRKAAVKSTYTSPGIPCKATDADAVPVLCVGAQRVGEVSYVRRGATSTSGARASGSKGTGAGDTRSAAEQLKERQAALALRRQKHVTVLVLEAIDAICEDSVALTQLADRLGAEGLVAAALAFGTRHNYLGAHGYSADRGIDDNHPDRWKAYAAYLADPNGVHRLLTSILRVLHERVDMKSTDARPHTAEIKKVCALLEIDLEELESRAVNDHPDPKSWAKLREAVQVEKDAAKEAAKAGKSTDKPAKKAAKKATKKAAATAESKRAQTTAEDLPEVRV